MSLTEPSRRRNPVFVAVQIPEEGKSWVEAGRFSSYADAFEAFERNDTNTILFGLHEFARLIDRILTAVADL
jgi:hypothetical protein